MSILIKINILEPLAKVVIPVKTGIQRFLKYIEKTGFPLKDCGNDVLINRL
jgi:hypothetical protein